MKNLRWRALVVLVTVLLGLFALYPTIRFFRLDDEQQAALEPGELDRMRAQALKLGLDLQGGMHLVLEIDDTKAADVDTKDLMDRALEVIRNRVDEFGVAEPVVQKAGEKRIIVELAGVDDFERAQQIISRAAVLEFKMVRSGDEMRRLIERLDLELSRLAGMQSASSEDTGGEDAPEDTTDATTAAAGEDDDTPAPLIELPDPLAGGVDAAADFDSAASDMLPTLAQDVKTSGGRPLASRIQSIPRQGRIAVNEIGTVRASDLPYVERYLALLDSVNAVPDDVEFAWDAELYTDAVGTRAKQIYLLTASPALTGEALEDARAQPDYQSNVPGNFLVEFDLTRAGRRLFSRATGENVGRLMAIVLDGRVKSAPEIEDKIRTGTATITGRFEPEEAADLSIVLRAGALPVPIRIEEQRAVGPSLGRDSIDLGKKAILYGFLGVLVFLLFYYRAAGGIAAFAIVLNIVLLLALLARLGAVLTLPGIAGLVLTVGMAVDANVLIFERIREEVRLGQSARNAVSRGFDRAFRTILDANVTTLITALVLLRFGAGPVKGFAVTLSFGIVISMFTALFVSRVIFDLIMQGGRVEKLSI